MASGRPPVEARDGLERREPGPSLPAESPVDADQHPAQQQRRPPPAQIHDQVEPDRCDAGEGRDQGDQPQDTPSQPEQRPRIGGVLTGEQGRLPGRLRPDPADEQMDGQQDALRQKRAGGEGADRRRHEDVLDAGRPVDG